MGLHKEQPADTRLKLKSFNEGKEILFDVEKHEYTYKGKKLKSATTFVKDFEDTFDGQKVSSRCADKWGVDQDMLLDMWDSNGKAASLFGTAMHAIMEHYFTYKNFGGEVMLAADKDNNAAMPNHPFLQQVIAGIEEIRVHGESYQEALVSSVKYGICGLVDDLYIVERKKKICRIRDYKFTYDILVNKKELDAPFEYLGANKLAKYYLQLCFYGFLMQLSGWTVEGIDIFNWDGQWHIHTLEGPDLMRTMVLIGSHYVKWWSSQTVKRKQWPLLAHSQSCESGTKPS